MNREVLRYKDRVGPYSQILDYAANTPAYFSTTSLTKKSAFLPNKLKVYEPGKTFQTSLMFLNKVWSLP